MTSNDGQQTVLVVSSDRGLSTAVAGWLENAGYQVMTCPGPRGSQARCYGLQGGRCALDAGADLTVLDLHPVGPDLVDRTTRAALVDLYRSGNRPVLVLADELGCVPQDAASGAAVSARTTNRGSLLATVAELLRSPACPQPTSLPAASTESSRTSSGRAQHHP